MFLASQFCCPWREVLCVSHSGAAHFSPKPLMVFCPFVCFFQSWITQEISFTGQDNQLKIPAELLLFDTAGSVTVNGGNHQPQLASSCYVTGHARRSTYRNEYALFITMSELDSHFTDKQSKRSHYLTRLWISRFSSRMLSQNEVLVLRLGCCFFQHIKWSLFCLPPSLFGKSVPSSSFLVSF